MLVVILVFLLILSVLVLIHEAGHYFVAKHLGIKVEEFGFGFPLTKSIFSIKRGETIYSFYPVLIGGFVKLFGEDEAGAGRVEMPKEQKAISKEDEKRAFFSRSVGQRASVVVAGVLMNVVLAVVIYYIFIFASGFTTPLPLLSDNVPAFVGANEKLIPKGIAIGKIAPNSPAEKAGIKAPSILLSVNGIKITGNDQLIKIINQNKGKQITLTWKDLTSEEQLSTQVVPRINSPKNEGAVGIAFDYSKYNIVILNYESPVQKAFMGISHTYNMLVYNAEGLRVLFEQSVQEKNIGPIAKNVGGPIGIGFIVGDVVGIKDLQTRILQLLFITGMLSISLAFVNVLPIPGLDGGRLFFILFEAIFRKKINPKIEGYIHTVGMVFLLFLLLLITINDINMHKEVIINYFLKGLHP